MTEPNESDRKAAERALRHFELDTFTDFVGWLAETYAQARAEERERVIEECLKKCETGLRLDIPLREVAAAIRALKSGPTT